jgi:hypothetical protein
MTEQCFWTLGLEMFNVADFFFSPLKTFGNPMRLLVVFFIYYVWTTLVRYICKHWSLLFVVAHFSACCLLLDIVVGMSCVQWILKANVILIRVGPRLEAHVRTIFNIITCLFFLGDLLGEWTLHWKPKLRVWVSLKLNPCTREVYRKS